MAGEQTDWDEALGELVRRRQVREAAVHGVDVTLGAEALTILTGTCARLVNALLTGAPLDVSEPQLAAIHGATLRALHALEQADTPTASEDERVA